MAALGTFAIIRWAKTAENATDYSVMNATLVAGPFAVPVPVVSLGMAYSIRMKGTTTGGGVYLSNAVTYPGACPVQIALDVAYDEAGCGQPAGHSSITAQIKKLNATTRTKALSYFVQNPEGLQLLRKIDLATSDWGGATLDTTGMAEGKYPVKAVLNYFDPTVNEDKMAEASGILVVDRQAPAARLTYPTSSLQVCANSITGASGTWFGIPVEGVVADNTRVKRFELLFGVGDNPTSWLPAKTRSGGTSADIKGTSAVTGEVGVLDVADVRNTDLSLKLKVVDAAGNASCSTTSFHIMSLPEVRNLVATSLILSPNGDGASDKVKASYSVDGSATVETRVFQLDKNADGSFALAAMFVGPTSGLLTRDRLHAMCRFPNAVLLPMVS